MDKDKSIKCPQIWHPIKTACHSTPDREVDMIDLDQPIDLSSKETLDFLKYNDPSENGFNHENYDL